MPLNARGATLVEVMIAALIIALGVSAVSTALLTADRAAKKSDGRERGAVIMAGVLDELRTYVTADPSPHPGAPGDPPDSWRLPGDSCGCWALQEGRHDVSSRLPPELRAAGGRLTYDVTLVNAGGQALRRVEAQLTWNEDE